MELSVILIILCACYQIKLIHIIDTVLSIVAVIYCDCFTSLRDLFNVTVI